MIHQIAIQQARFYVTTKVAKQSLSQGRVPAAFFHTGRSGYGPCSGLKSRDPLHQLRFLDHPLFPRTTSNHLTIRNALQNSRDLHLAENPLQSGLRLSFSSDVYALHPGSTIEVIYPAQLKDGALQGSTVVVLGATGTMGKDCIARLKGYCPKVNIMPALRSVANTLLSENQLNTLSASKEKVIIVNAVGASNSFKQKYEALKVQLQERSISFEVIDVSLHNPLGDITVTPVKTEIQSSATITSTKEWKSYSEFERVFLSIWGQQKPLVIHKMDEESGKVNQAIMHLCLMGTLCAQRLVITDPSELTAMLETVKTSARKLIQSRSDNESAATLAEISCQFVDAFSDYLSKQSEEEICRELIEQTKGGLDIVAARKTMTPQQGEKLYEALDRHGLVETFERSHGRWWSEKL